MAVASGVPLTFDFSSIGSHLSFIALAQFGAFYHFFGIDPASLVNQKLHPPQSWSSHSSLSSRPCDRIIRSPSTYRLKGFNIVTYTFEY
jgi:hypothetical protein